MEHHFQSFKWRCAVTVQRLVRGWLAREKVALEQVLMLTWGDKSLVAHPSEVVEQVPLGQVGNEVSTEPVEIEVSAGLSVLPVAPACDGRAREYRTGCTFVVVEVNGDERWGSLLTLFDTGAMMNTVVRSVVQSGWLYVRGGPDTAAEVESLGGHKVAVGGEVVIPAHAMVYKGQRNDMVATVVDSIPHGVELLIGLPVILNPMFSVHVDMPGWRVYVRALGEVVRLDLVSRMRARRSYGSVSLLSLCSGMCVEGFVALELMMQVERIDAVEFSPVSRAMAQIALPMVRFVMSNDVVLGDRADLADDYFGGVAGPNCVHWSCLRDAPGGYREDGSQTFTACASVLAEKAESCGMNRLLETVQVHRTLKDDERRQAKECGGPLQDLCSREVGGPAGRKRRYFAPGVDFARIERFKHANPDWTAASGWLYRDRPVPCVVASGKRTKCPIYLIRDGGNWNERLCCSDERDRLNPALAAGISCGYGQLKLTSSVRDRANGNAFGADALWAIMRMWEMRPKLGAVLTLANDMRSWPAAEQMAAFRSMSASQRWDYFHRLAADLVMPKLDVAGMVDRMHDAGFQTSAPGFTKSGLGPSCDYCIDLAIRDGSHKEVEWSADLWIVLLFFQKKGRTVVAEFDGATYKKGDILQAMRPLRDYQVLNSAIAAKIPAYWKEFCPTVEGMRSLFPWWCTMLCVHDCANAFHSVLLTEGSKKYCNSRYRDANGKERIVQCVGGDQGISAMALFFPVWVRFGYFHFFGQAWLEGVWWLDFMDDSCIMGDSRTGDAAADARLKCCMMTMVKRLMGMEVSPKQDVSVYAEVEFCGLFWSAAGISMGDDAVQYILGVLGDTPKGVKQARMVRGVIVQAKSGFFFSPEEMIRFNTLMGVITEVIVEAEREGGKYHATAELRAALDELASRLKDQKRRYTNPDELLADGRCLALLGDADPSAIVSTLWLIAKNDANDVDPSDFESATSVLLGMRPKTLTGSALVWHISEKELMVMVYGVRVFGKLVSECVARWALTADQSAWYYSGTGQLVATEAKVCFASDSNAALGMLLALQLPTGRLEHLTPKIERTKG